MELNVARSEFKYAVSEIAAARIRANLGDVMKRDPMGGSTGYMVRSLYFDTPDDRDYYDKIDGLEVRQKVRLRIYSSRDTTAKLELKRKEGAYQWKRSIILSREDAELLSEGRYSIVRKRMDSPFSRQLLTMMELNSYEPKTLIEYRRLAFVADIDNTRITFDTSLRASQSGLDLFAAHPAYHPILHPPILEVKYTHFFMSHIKFALNVANQMPMAISKYCLGRQISFY